MRITNIISFIFLALILVGFKKDKCNSDSIYEEAVKRLKKFSLIKDYRVYLKKNKKNDPEDYEYFNLTLNRGVKYKFTTVNSPEFDGKLVLNLYTSPKKEFLFATTLNPVNGNVRETVEFLCQSTGNYCIGFYFCEGKEGCGVCVSGFMQQ
ncbi:MAG: hypothetical protein ACXVPN_11170 [Bacteroidia bacterium]